MQLTSIHTIYFIGIGGIGMSNLARYMQHIEKNVLGYDKTSSPLTDALQNEGIQIRFDIDKQWIIDQNWDIEQTLIVYTPAVKQWENEELDYLMYQGFRVVKRSELLGIITQNTICLAVAGTHGKTTTSTLLSHILKSSGVAATGFLGGISENYHTNLVLGGNEYSVVEADEYDRSFLKLFPDFACITATDPDHLDIYKDQTDFEETFHQFAALVSKKLFVKYGINIKGETFGFEDAADYQALNVRVENGAFVFDVKTPTKNINNIVLNLPGRHNVLNALAAFALSQTIGVDTCLIAKAIASFKGVERRFSFRIKNDKLVLIDDYAHHPTEINALHDAVRELYPNKKISIIFQPHTFTRTRDFFNGFIESLAQFDAVYLLPIYAAREHPIDGITSNVIVEGINNEINKAQMIDENALLSLVENSNNQIICMVGAGDIGEMITDVVNSLIKKVN